MEKIEVIVDLSRHKMVTKTTDLSTLYSVYQYNGQIIATFKHASTPKRGSEVYIKHIKEDTLLQDVLEFALKAGQIFQIRLLTEFSGYLRSYCFVTYFSVKAARKAVLVLNGAVLNGNRVVVKVSHDNNRLEIRSVPIALTPDQLKEQFHGLIGVGLKDVKITRYSQDSKFKKCLLLYDTHRNALEARKKLYPKFRLFDSYIMEIDWASPEELKMCYRLYFRSLPKSVTKIQLLDSLEKYIRVETMLNIFLQQGLGYILFVSQIEAYRAYGTLTGKRICGVQLEFSFNKFFKHLTDESEYLTDEPEYPAKQGNASSDRPETMYAGEPLHQTSGQAQTSWVPSCIPEFPDEMKLLQNFMIPSSVPPSNQASVISPNLHPCSVSGQTSGTMPTVYTTMMATPPSAVPVPNSCPLPTMNGCGAALPAMATPFPNPLGQTSGGMPTMMATPPLAVLIPSSCPIMDGCGAALPATPLPNPLAQTSAIKSNVYTVMVTPSSAVPVPTSCTLPTTNGCGAALPVMTTPVANPLPTCYYFNDGNVDHYLRSGLQSNTNSVLNEAYLNFMNPQLEQYPLIAEYNQIEPVTNLFLSGPWPWY